MERNQQILKFGITVVACLIVVGCDTYTEPKKPLSQDFGNAVHHNMAVQIVNPEASAAISAPPTLDGNRANAVMTEYQGGTTKKVETIKTSDVSQ